MSKRHVSNVKLFNANSLSQTEALSEETSDFMVPHRCHSVLRLKVFVRIQRYANEGEYASIAKIVYLRGSEEVDFDETTYHQLKENSNLRVWVKFSSDENMFSFHDGLVNSIGIVSDRLSIIETMIKKLEETTNKKFSIIENIITKYIDRNFLPPEPS